MLYLCERFGAASVLGRPMSAGEIQRMLVAEKITLAFRARAQAADWVTWAKEHKEDSDLLAIAMAAL